MHGLNLLKKGIIWRVGNGKQIRIWREPWIPREHTHRVIFHRGRNRIHWVANLLNSEGTVWDYNTSSTLLRRMPLPGSGYLLEDRKTSLHGSQKSQGSSRSGVLTTLRCRSKTERTVRRQAAVRTGIGSSGEISGRAKCHQK